MDEGSIKKGMYATRARGGVAVKSAGLRSIFPLSPGAGVPSLSIRFSRRPRGERAREPT